MAEKTTSSASRSDRRLRVHHFTVAIVFFAASLSFSGSEEEGPSIPTALGTGILRCGAPAGRVYQAPRERGERDLARLARTARIEDAWIYLEAEELWVDVGAKESRTSVELDMGALRSALGGRSHDGELITLYHIHPRRVLPEGPIYPADGNDVYAGAHLKRFLRDRHGARLEARVFDGYGVWSYDVSDSLETFLRLPDYSGERLQWIAVNEARPCGTPREAMMRRYGDFLVGVIALLEPVAMSRARSRSERINDYIRRARTLGIRLSYESLARSE